MITRPSRLRQCPDDHAIAVPAAHERTMSRLFQAIQGGHPTLIDALLPLVDDRWGLGHDRDTVLIHAATEGALDVVERALARGARPDLMNRSGQTALWCAADRGRLAVVQRLLPVGRPFLRDARLGHTAFMRAIVNGHTEVVHALLPAVDVNQATHDDVTPVMLAVLNKRDALVDLLVSAGAALSVLNRHRETVIDLARSSGASPDLIARLNVHRERTALTQAANDLTDRPSESSEIPTAPTRSRL